MSDQPTSDLPPFDLPAWGEEGAPVLGEGSPTSTPEPTGRREPREPDDVVLTTTETIEGRTITAYLGIVAGEASVSIGQRGSAAAVREARVVALDLLRRETHAMAAMAVVGLRLDTVVRKQDVAVVAFGTAVHLM